MLPPLTTHERGHRGSRGPRFDSSLAFTPTGRPRAAPGWAPSAAVATIAQLDARSIASASRGRTSKLAAILSRPTLLDRLLRDVRLHGSVSASANAAEVLRYHASVLLPSAPPDGIPKASV